MSVLTFLHIKDSAWKGVYLDGKKISDGYYNLQEITKAEEELNKYGALIGLTIRHFEKDMIWFSELGGKLPDYIKNDAGITTAKPEQNWGINYYRVHL